MSAEKKGQHTLRYHVPSRSMTSRSKLARLFLLIERSCSSTSSSFSSGCVLSKYSKSLHVGFSSIRFSNCWQSSFDMPSCMANLDQFFTTPSDLSSPRAISSNRVGVMASQALSPSLTVIWKFGKNNIIKSSKKHFPRDDFFINCLWRGDDFESTL